MQNNSETSKTSTRQLTLEDLISSQEGSPVNRSALQENEKDPKTNATCGRRCLELSESVNRVGSWERTFAGLLIGRTDWFSKRVALTWKLSGTPSNRLLFQLVPQALPTEGTEFGLLLIGTTSRSVIRSEKFKKGRTPRRIGISMERIVAHNHNRDRTEERLQTGRQVDVYRIEGNRNAPDTFSDKRPQRRSKANRSKKAKRHTGLRDARPRDWKDFPSVPPVCGGDDGLPKELDGITFSKWRRESIKAYGNAIVPQVAYRIFEAIQEYEKRKKSPPPCEELPSHHGE